MVLISPSASGGATAPLNLLLHPEDGSIFSYQVMQLLTLCQQLSYLITPGSKKLAVLIILLLIQRGGKCAFKCNYPNEMTTYIWGRRTATAHPVKDEQTWAYLNPNVLSLSRTASEQGDKAAPARPPRNAPWRSQDGANGLSGQSGGSGGKSQHCNSYEKRDKAPLSMG